MTWPEAVMRNAEALYAELEKRADNGTFTGSRVHAFQTLDVSNTYYSLVYRLLTESGCIEEVQRGNRRQPSIIALHGAPDREKLQAMYRASLTRPRSIDTLRDYVSELEGRLEALEREVERIAEAQATTT
jgi:hypothetical protein